MQDKLLKWYDKNHRQLPWRENRDPYRIWLSEIMLQQTQVATVINYFNRFIKAYPTVEDLATAIEDDVLKLWEGLGYYSRARRLIPCARMVVEKYDGKFPQTYDEIIKLPGIGSYTAGAVLSIAYNKKVPAVDGNVMRVYSRYYDMDNDISLAKSKKIFEEKVYETLPGDRCHYNQALMELGATICTPKNYQCEQCPISAGCKALELNIQDKRPVKSKKIKKKHERIAACYITCEDKVLIMKRPSDGLLPGLWAFPVIKIEQDVKKDIILGLREEFDIEVMDILPSSETKHVYTHIVWDMTLYEMKTDTMVQVDFPPVKWVKPEELSLYALPKGFHKLLENRKKGGFQMSFC